MKESNQKTGVIIRSAELKDMDSILALNQELVHFLSPLTLEKLQHLDRESSIHWVVESQGEFAGFLLGFREGADYDSVNYTWFEAQYPQFLYVDRIVILPRFHGQGLGAALYDALFAQAAAIGIPYVTAEYYVVPPNQVSAEFHSRYGFVEVGRQQLGDSGKTVSLQVAPVPGILK